MYRPLLLASLISASMSTEGFGQDVVASSVNLGASYPSFSVDTGGNGFFNSMHSFDTVNINPSGGQSALLPVASLPCHQVNQSYVLSQSCQGSKAATAAETYGYSFNMVNLDDGSGTPASGSAGGAGNDKVVLYIGGDQQSSRSGLWGLNAVVSDHDGSAGVAGAEWDMNRFATCNSKLDLNWIGDASCPQFIGQWITGLNGGGTGGPAVFITQSGGNGTALWNDGIAISPGTVVRDTGFLDASNSATVVKATGTHDFGLDVWNSDITTAAVRMMSGNYRGSPNGQAIVWTPGPGINGFTGGTDSIADYGSGLDVSTDSSHVITLTGGNVLASAGALFLQNPTVTGVQLPFIQQDAAGNIRVGQIASTSGGLDVDGNVQAANIVVRGSVVFPISNGNQTMLTTDSGGSLHIAGTTGSSALDVDEPTNFSNLTASGTVSASNVTSSNAVSYGTGNAGGNHMVTEEAVSAYGMSGVLAMTPQGGLESATNNIAVITTGGAKVTADIMCQNGTDMSSWIVKGTYVVVGGTLKLLGSSTTVDIPSTVGADTWQVAITTDTQNSAPELVVGFPATNTTNVDCTARVEVIIVK